MKTSIKNTAIVGHTIYNTIRRSFPLMLVVIVLLVSACHDKTNGQNSATSKDAASGKVKENKIKPKISVNVNRRYDDKGNLVGFDSTYSSYYSNIAGDTAKMDSLFANFDHFFNTGQPTLMNKEFNSLFFRDSIMYPDFFHDDFFLKRYELNDPYMRNMMVQMDSIKNQFYEQQIRRKKIQAKKK